MKRFVILAVTCWTLLACAVAGAMDPVEGPPSCKQCGMDRTAFAYSRVLITYDDGTTAGLCSIHCAAKEMKQNAGKQVKSIMVADYGTKELTDAKSATWVIGGQEKGVMTSEPKWAFARAEDARKFVAEKGGRTATFDEALQAAQTESGAVACACEGPGGHMLFNPAFGDDIYHTHPAGMWMVSMKEMHMAMDGLRDGTSNVSTSQVGNNRGRKYDNYMMIPTSMHMDMQMLMVMYGITDRWTVMAMANYLETKMDMVMDMSPFNMMGMPKAVDPGAQADDPMRTSGLSDTELRGIYKFTEYMSASLGLSLPTGDIDQDFTTMGTKWRAPYDMQLGSGTFDLKPALTLNFLSDDALWNWGGQAMYTTHLGKNSNDYSLGDSLKLNTWLQRALGPAATWIRLSYSNTGSINGHDDEIQKSLNLKGPLNPTGNYMAPAMPDADPNNYGGQRIDGFVGFSIPVKAVSFGVEAGVPLYQDLNGLQMKNDWYLTAGIQTMF